MPRVTLVRPAALTTFLRLDTVPAPPLGVAYLAGTLRAGGIDVTVVDAVGEAPARFLPLDFTDRGYSCGLSMAETVAAIPADTDIVGFSCMFSSSWPYDRRLIDAVRARCPDAILVCGGEHITGCTEHVMASCPAVDICVHGEGEETILDLVRAVRAGTDLGSVPGITFRGPGGALRKTAVRARIRDIDAIPAPAWDLVPLNNYIASGLNYGSRRVRSIPLLATRGCPYTCTFCSSPAMWTTRWAARDPVLLVDEMERCVAQYNVENFDLYDLTAIIKRSWFVAFARELLDRGLQITYELPTGSRAESIDAEVADLLYRSGCRNMSFSPETGSERTLKKVRKKLDLPRITQAMADVVARGVNVTAQLVMFPDEDWDDISDTFRFVMTLARIGVHDIRLFPYIPYPGAAMYEELRLAGRVPPLSDEFFLFLLEQGDLLGSHSFNPMLSGRQLQGLRLAFFASFYGAVYWHRPNRIPRNLRNLVRNTPEGRGEKAIIDLAVRLGKMIRLRGRSAGASLAERRRARRPAGGGGGVPAARHVVGV